MAQQTVQNGDSGLVARNKINQNFTELYAVDEDQYKEANGYISPTDFSSFGDQICPDTLITGELILTKPQSLESQYTFGGVHGNTRRSDSIGIINATSGWIVQPSSGFAETQQTIAKIKLGSQIKKIMTNNLVNLSIIKNAAEIDPQTNTSTSNDILINSNDPNQVFNGGECRLRDMSTPIATPVWTNTGFVGIVCVQDANYFYVANSATTLRRIDKVTGLTTGTDINLPAQTQRMVIDGTTLRVGTNSGLTRVNLTTWNIITSIGVPNATGWFVINPVKPNTITCTITASPGFREIDSASNTLRTRIYGRNGGFGKIWVNSVGQLFGTTVTGGSTTSIIEIDATTYADIGSYTIDIFTGSSFGIGNMNFDNDIFYMLNSANGLYFALWSSITKRSLTTDCRFPNYAMSLGVSKMIGNGNKLYVTSSIQKLMRLTIGTQEYSTDGGTTRNPLTFGTQYLDIEADESDEILIRSQFTGVTHFIPCTYARACLLS